MAIDDERGWLLLELADKHELLIERPDGRGITIRWPDLPRLAQVVGSSIEERASSPFAPRDLPPPRFPVFVAGPRRAVLLRVQVERGLRPLVERDRIQLVELSRRDFVARAPFELPLDVVAIGEAAQLVEPLHRALGDVGLPPGQGASLETMSLGLYQWQRGRRHRIDLLVADADAGNVVMRLGRTAWPPRHPRVLIVADRMERLRTIVRRQVPPGMAVVAVPADEPSRASGFLVEMTLGLIHNLPLHEAVARAADQVDLRGKRHPRLFADPASNWSVSMTDAYTGVVDRSGAVLEALRATGRLQSNEGRRLENAFSGLRADFSRELNGFVPVAIARSAMRQVARQAPADAAEPVGRSVDIALERITPIAAQHHVDPARPHRVSSDTVLAGERRYRLVVQIGGALAGSLLIERPPPLDVLLPPTEADGWLLEIAVVGLGVEVEGDAVHRLRLPLVGPTDPARFTIRTSADPGRARILVTYLDQVVQTFILTAAVGPDEEIGRPGSLRVELEHTISEQLSNLGALRARTAAFVLNDDPAGTHTLSIKRGGDLISFRFTEAAVSTTIDTARTLLTTAIGNQLPIFPEPPPAEPSAAWVQRVASFDDTIRQLASYGAFLHDAVFTQSDGAAGDAILDAIRVGRDRILHLTQLSAAFSFPWNLVYDWPLPSTPNQLGKLPVCRGFVGAAECGHDHQTTAVICCRGFWGLRHRIEQILRNTTKTDIVDKVVGFDPGARLRIAISNTAKAAALVPGFQTRADAPGIAITAGASVNDLLWSSSRPAMFVALGHHSAHTSPVPRNEIDLDPPLIDRDVIGASKGKRWTDPHTLVVLPACGSAATPLGTLLGMTTAFFTARASGLIGTETDVFAGGASSFVEELQARMLGAGTMSLATAMQEARWVLIRGASPLGFTFVAFGSGDLRIEEPGGI